MTIASTVYRIAAIGGVAMILRNSYANSLLAILRPRRRKSNFRQQRFHSIMTKCYR
ncbi:hypothetical protein M405DRAFT_828069 [Rhizopogon salebrosus TDB-379]|nr:hypothetical protein M405DRAFT_828069 [Rhizopogon salebrosus TDB-379]